MTTEPVTFDRLRQIADRLRDLAAAVESGSLPPVHVSGLESACNRVERDLAIKLAAHQVGGCGALLALLRAQAWRLDVWRQRGRAPEGAHPALKLLFAAGRLPTERHIRRIVNGHSMSDEVGFNGGMNTTGDPTA